MKKTMIALAAVAAVGAASAQVSLTGSTTAYWMNVSDNSYAGLVLGGANITFAASEDMGGGWAASTKLTLDLDGGRDAKAYHGDRSITLAGPMGSLTMANTRSGGTQGAAFVAPVNLWNDFWGSGAKVLTRANVDALVFGFPVSKELSLAAKYIEGGCNTATATKAEYVACGAVDGSAVPGAASYDASLKWASGPLVIMAAATSTTYNDQTRANLLAIEKVASPRTQSYAVTTNYNAGFANFGLGYDSPRRGKAEGTDQGAVLASFSAPLGATSVGLNYGLRDGQSILQLGAAYSLSKRTTLNLSWGQYTNAADAAGAPVAALVESALSLSHSF